MTGFERHAPLAPSDVKELLRRLIDSAAQGLRGRPAPSDAALHKARKQIKRARARLRLLRDAAGTPAYHRENAQLRNAARPLSHVRDARVVLLALDGVLDGASRRGALAALRRELRHEQLRARRELLGSSKLKRIGKSLEAAGRRVGLWRFSRDDEAVLQAGIVRIYRKGRKKMAQAESSRSDEALHEARKQVKYLERALEVFEPTGARRIVKAIKRAKAVGDRLGADHDLAVLRRRIVALNARGGDVLFARIEGRREKLRNKALKKGRRLYRKKAKKFRERLEAALAQPAGT